jgi:CheY-like chemotaxis protein
MHSGVRRRAPTVLFVEDSPEVRELHCTAFVAAGLIVREVASIGDALEALTLTPPDLVVMDRELPDGDGFELAARIKQDPVTSHVLVIGFTAGPTREAMNAAHAARMDGFVVKPCQASKLLGLVRGLLADVAQRDDGETPSSRRC